MLEFDIKNIEALKRRFDPTIVEKSLVRSINRVSGKVKTRVSRNVRGYYNIKARDVASALKFTRAKRGHEQALLLYAGKKIGLAKFGARERTVRVNSKRWGKTRKQVRVKVVKSRGLQVAESAEGIPGFMHNGRIYARKGQARKPLKHLSGPAVAQMVDNHAVIDEMNEFIEQALPEEFNHNLEHYLFARMGIR